MNKKIRIIGIVIMAVAVVFLVRRFLSFDVDYSELFAAKTLPALALVTIAIMGTLFMGGFVWNIWLSFFSGKRVSVLATYSVYARSNLAKYLPGNVGQFAMRQIYGTSLGIRQRELLFSSILEIFCLAITALILSLLLARDAFLLYLSDLFHNAWVLPVIIVVIVAVIVFAVVFIRKKKISASEILDYLKQEKFRISLIVVFGLAACILAVYGTTLLILFGSNANLGAHGLVIVSAGIVSWFVGYVTPGVPGGIGVREAVLLLMLSPIMADEVVLFAAVMQRLAFIFSDVFSWVVGKAIK